MDKFRGISLIAVLAKFYMASVIQVMYQCTQLPKEVAEVQVVGFEEGHSTVMIIFMLMQLISLLHVFFDVLAFRSDVGFWKGRETMSGLSSRAVLSSAAQSAQPNLTPPSAVRLALSQRRNHRISRVRIACDCACGLWRITVAQPLSSISTCSATAMQTHLPGQGLLLPPA